MIKCLFQQEKTRTNTGFLVLKVNKYILNLQTQACQGMARFLVSNPREDKGVFLLRPCILTLKVAKNFRQTFFRGDELIRVEVLWYFKINRTFSRWNL